MTRLAKTVPVKREKAAPAAPAEGTSPVTRLLHGADDVFDRFFDLAPMFRPEGRFAPRWDRGWWTGYDLDPRMDVVETDTGYELTAELPGMDEKDIELVLKDRWLTLKGEKREEHEEAEKDYRLCERSYGAFERSFVLPEGVDAGKVNARFAKGLLHVTLPKTREAKLKERRIPVEAA